MSVHLIRLATAADAAAIAAIYNQAVIGSTATFDTEPRSVEERQAWLAGHDEAHPVTVLERDGVVVGWASLTPAGERRAWEHTVEISTYVDDSAHGTGVGRALGVEIMDRARALGHHVVISRICAENEASIHLAGKLGFERVGVMHEVGRKFDRWLDVVILEKRV